MNIAVIGAGYVGLVTGAGLAALGHRVRIGEADPERLAQLQAGGVPLHEAGLGPILSKTVGSGLLTFHADNNEAVADALVVMIALPTPPSADGSADLATIEAALDAMAGSLEPGVVVAMKSTVPVGSVARFQDYLDARGVDAAVVSNPEFLREGSAVHDFFHPDRIVIGARIDSAAETLTEMYRGIDAPVVITDPPSSEMIKYASNAYLATRITFANVLANLCESVGADASVVLDGMVLLHRFLVRIVDTGEVGEVSGTGPGVEALGVACLAHVDRRRDVDLDEGDPGALVSSTNRVPIPLIGADHRHEHHEAGVRHQAGNLTVPSHVLGPVICAESEVSIESVPHVVTVKRVRGSTSVDQFLLDKRRNGRLAASGEAGHPHGHPGTAGHRGALGAVDGSGVPDDVLGH